MVEDFIKSQNRNEDIYPHSPDVLERELSDNGFSKGWGMHFTPVAKYWIDVHTHVMGNNPEDEYIQTKHILRELIKLNVRSVVAISPMISITDRGDVNFERYLSDNKSITHFIKEMHNAKNAFPFLYLYYSKPDLKLLNEAIKAGVCGIKLHNAPMIMNGADPEIWLSEDWGKAFDLIEKHNLPVLWHVTQRLTESPYNGGGRNSYWKEGWKKGVKYTNEDLLQVYLRVVEKFPKIDFISAHQLHMGWDRLTELLDSYENLYTDTSCGCSIMNNHELYDHDREYLRNIFIKYNKRIIFGTDLLIEDDMIDYHINNLYNEDMRFINLLRLPDEAVQNISHGNIERILRLLQNN